jgi:hypothetical protein
MSETSGNSNLITGSTLEAQFEEAAAIEASKDFYKFSKRQNSDQLRRDIVGHLSRVHQVLQELGSVQCCYVSEGTVIAGTLNGRGIERIHADTPPHRASTRIDIVAGTEGQVASFQPRIPDSLPEFADGLHISLYASYNLLSRSELPVNSPHPRLIIGETAVNAFFNALQTDYESRNTPGGRRIISTADI